MHKILSYLFICIGVLLIFFSLISMYKVFVDRQPAAPVVNTLANLGLFALFMAFVLSVGAKLAGLGAKMLKSERIRDALLELKTTEIPSEENLKNL